MSNEHLIMFWSLEVILGEGEGAEEAMAYSLHYLVPSSAYPSVNVIEFRRDGMRGMEAMAYPVYYLVLCITPPLSLNASVG